MDNKVTIYKRPRDMELWDWARIHADTAGLSTSHIVSQALREYRNRVEALADRDEVER